MREASSQFAQRALGENFASYTKYLRSSRSAPLRENFCSVRDKPGDKIGGKASSRLIRAFKARALGAGRDAEGFADARMAM